MVDDELFEELEISKSEIIEEYSAGELGQKERKWLEHNFLATGEGQRSHAFAAAIGSISPRQLTPKSPSFLDGLRLLWKRQPWPIAVAAACLLLVPSAGALLLRSSNPKTTLALNLINSTSKRAPGDAQYPTVNLTSDVRELRISLVLPQSFPRAANYRAELDNRLQSKTLNPVAHDENSVVVVIPAAELQTGLYSLRLYATNADGKEERIPGDYLFSVTNPS